MYSFRKILYIKFIGNSRVKHPCNEELWHSHPRIPPYPSESDIESKAILKKVALANRYLAELKGVVSSVPNENILIATLTLQEAKDSSVVENIITTHNELFQAGVQADALQPAAKEVQNYATALQAAF